MPVKEILIEEIGARGDGIGRVQGESVFIQRTATGDTVEAELFRGRDGMLRAKNFKRLQPGPDRSEAPCPHYDSCGGCSLQHITQDSYRNWKQDIVRQALARKGIEPATWEAPIFIPPGTRRRSTFAVYKQKDRVLVGYYKRRSHTISDIPDCLVLHPDLIALQEKLRPYMGPILKDSRPASLSIQKSGNDFEMMFTGPLGKKKEPDMEVRTTMAEMAEALDITRIYWRERDRDDLEPMVLRRDFIARMGPLTVSLPPAAFLQASAEGETALAQTVMDYLPVAARRCADLFSGCGTFSGPLLNASGRVVHSFESNENAVHALQKAAHAAKASLTANKHDLFEDPLGTKELSGFDAVVFDPPRAGAKAQAEKLAESNVPNLIGVSCNPATFARDARILIDGGYRLDKFKIIDQFVWSHHVELVGLFVKT